MSVIIELNYVTSYLRGYLQPDIYKKINILLSYRMQKADFMPSFKNNRWDGRIHLFSMEDLSFPTGLYLKIVKFLNDINIQYTIQDNRVQSKRYFDYQWVHPKIKELHPYQKSSVEIAIEKKNGIIQVATGGGKSIIMCKVVQELGRKTLILVHKLDLLEQARNHLKNALGIEIGYIGDGKLDIKDVTVGTVQTIVRSLGFKYLKFINEEIDEKKELKEQDKEKVRELLRTVNVVIIDECHHVRSETQQNIMNNVLIADYRIGLSATPMRDQGDDLLIEGIFGEILCKISASYLIENKFLIKPEITFNHINHTIFYFYEIVKIDRNNNVIYYNPPSSNGSNTGRRRNVDIMWDDLSERSIINITDINQKDILYEYDNGYKLIRKWIKYEGATNFVHHIYTKLEEICNAAYNDVLQNEIILNKINVNNTKLYDKFIRKFKREHSNLKMKGKYAFVYDACITDNEYRNMYIAQLLNLHYINNRSILVLVTRLRHGDNILKMLCDDVIFLKGEDDLQTRNNVVEKIKIRKIREIIASTIADEGLDLPALDVVIMAGGGTSKTTALQRVGRALRLYKDKIIAYIEEFYDDAQYLSKHSKDRADIYKTEPAFIIKGL
ncbi:MAG: DEAD/DEAH box helicase family protein [Methanothrix sp.]|nr:DEAD/DEAH box helicase family protein [Methanothrix sp.]